MQRSHLCREIRGQQSLTVLALGKSTSLLVGVWLPPPPHISQPGKNKGSCLQTYLEGILRAEWWGWGSLQRRPRVEEAGKSGWVKWLRCCPAPLRVQSQRWGLPGCALPQ